MGKVRTLLTAIWETDMDGEVLRIRVMRKICGIKRDEITEEWRRLHSEELHDLCYSINTIWVIKLKRMR